MATILQTGTLFRIIYLSKYFYSGTAVPGIALDQATYLTVDANKKI